MGNKNSRNKNKKCVKAANINFDKKSFNKNKTSKASNKNLYPINNHYLLKKLKFKKPEKLNELIIYAYIKKYETNINNIIIIPIEIQNIIIKYIGNIFIPSIILDILDYKILYYNLKRHFWPENARIRHRNDISLNLLYRASNKKWNTSIFHSICDKQNNIIIIIKYVSQNKVSIFGGYTYYGWNINDEQYTKDKDAIIFVLRNEFSNYNMPDIVYPAPSSFDKAIFNNKDLGPCFGDSFQVNLNNKTVKLSRTHVYPMRLQYFIGSDKITTLLQIQEMEVFQVLKQTA